MDQDIEDFSSQMEEWSFDDVRRAVRDAPLKALEMSKVDGKPTPKPPVLRIHMEMAIKQRAPAVEDRLRLQPPMEDYAQRTPSPAPHEDPNSVPGILLQMLEVMKQNAAQSIAVKPTEQSSGNILAEPNTEVLLRQLLVQQTMVSQIMGAQQAKLQQPAFLLPSSESSISNPFALCSNTQQSFTMAGDSPLNRAAEQPPSKQIRLDDIQRPSPSQSSSRAETTAFTNFAHTSASTQERSSSTSTGIVKIYQCQFFTCKRASQSSSTSQLFEQHYRNVHKDLPGYPCLNYPECRVLSMTNKDRKRHLKEECSVEKAIREEELARMGPNPL